MRDPLHLESFIEHLISRDRAERTIREYRADVEGFAQWFKQTNGRTANPKKVTALDIREWKAFMDTRGWKPATVNRRLAALRSYFDWALSHGLISVNPTHGIKDKRTERVAPKSLKRSQVRDLRKAAADHILLADSKRFPSNMTATAREARRDKAILYLLLGSGLRVGELCAILMKDLSLRIRSGEVIVRAGKGNKYRTVPLNKEARQAIEHWLEVRPETLEEHLFLGRTGLPMSPRAVQSVLSRLARTANLEEIKVSPHILRHTFAKSLVDAGEPLTKVQALLGHESIVSTARYTTPRPEDLASAVERISWED